MKTEFQIIATNITKNSAPFFKKPELLKSPLYMVHPLYICNCTEISY